jgi:NAD(P)H-dependent FMN reductase
MTTIFGLSGSLRRTSFNAGLLRAAAEVAPPEVTIKIGRSSRYRSMTPM